MRKIAGIMLVAGLVCAGAFLASRRLAHMSPFGSPQHKKMVLATKAMSNPPAMRLKESLKPPTNKWFSSLVFAAQPVAIYPIPLSFKPQSNGFEVGLPNVSATTDTIHAGHQPGIAFTFESNDYVVTDYDDLSVELTYQKEGQNILSARLTQGSPYIFVTALKNVTIRTSLGNMRSLQGAQIARLGNKVFGLKIHGRETTNGKLVELAAGDKLTVFAAESQNAFADILRHAETRILGTSVQAANVSGGVNVQYRLETTDNQPTIMALPPSLKPSAEVVPSVRYQSLLGQLQGYTASSFELHAPAASLPGKPTAISADEKAKLVSLLSDDIQKSAFSAPDAYFGGKQLYRAARLLEIAQTLEETQHAEEIADQLQTSLDGWLHSNQENYEKFVYEPRLKGVVAYTPSFGSEDFNDHHFHYGYFIYAASVLGAYRPDTVLKFRPVIDLLAMDIANPEETEQFIRTRHFDWYALHSWASGYGIFADGNNQESSSEAIHAWYAVYLWAQLTKNEAMSETARSLFSLESWATLQYWLRPPKDYISKADNYTHQLVSLVWGGKLDYATFFSPRPQAKLGIQLLPFGLANSHLENLSPASVRRLITEATPTAIDYNGQFGDYLIMLLARQDSKKAISLAQDLAAEHIDSANSKTALYYHIFTQ